MTLQEEWNHTNRHLAWLNKEFVILHNTPQKDWKDNDHAKAREYRRSAVETGEHRYWLLSLARKEGIRIV